MMKQMKNLPKGQGMPDMGDLSNLMGGAGEPLSPEALEAQRKQKMIQRKLRKMKRK